MIAIVISACLISDPEVCKDYRIPLSIDVDSISCALHAPPHFAKWAEEHPQWKIVRWGCRPASVSDT